LIVFMRLPQWLAEFNRHFTNPIQRLWAGFVPGMGIIEHVGRKSGKPYRTPVDVFPTDDGLAILLTYGPDRDWAKNLAAANGGKVKLRQDRVVRESAHRDEDRSGAVGEKAMAATVFVAAVRERAAAHACRLSTDSSPSVIACRASPAPVRSAANAYDIGPSSVVLEAVPTAICSSALTPAPFATPRAGWAGSAWWRRRARRRR
jgi:deazaflavin-dependent oxidoreductase (nitroreductase family)